MALSSDTELTPLIKSIMQLAKRLVDAERFSVYSVDSDNHQLFSHISEVTYHPIVNTILLVINCWCRVILLENWDRRRLRVWQKVEKKSLFLMLTWMNSFLTRLIWTVSQEISTFILFVVYLSTSLTLVKHVVHTY